MQILLIMLIVVLLAFSVLLLALAKQSPREKQTEKVFHRCCFFLNVYICYL